MTNNNENLCKITMNGKITMVLSRRPSEEFGRPSEIHEVSGIVDMPIAADGDFNLSFSGTIDTDKYACVEDGLWRAVANYRPPMRVGDLLEAFGEDISKYTEDFLNSECWATSMTHSNNDVVREIGLSSDTHKFVVRKEPA
jgi:hypothetical protein